MIIILRIFKKIAIFFYIVLYYLKMEQLLNSDEFTHRVYDILHKVH